MTLRFTLCWTKWSRDPKVCMMLKTFEQNLCGGSLPIFLSWDERILWFKLHHFTIMVDCDFNTKVRRCMHMWFSVKNCVPQVRDFAGLCFICSMYSILTLVLEVTLFSDSVEITNKMQLCNRIYHSTVHWRLNMFRAAYRSSSGALTVFAAFGLHTHVVTGRSQVCVGTYDERYAARNMLSLQWTVE